MQKNINSTGTGSNVTLYREFFFFFETDCYSWFCFISCSFYCLLTKCITFNGHSGVRPQSVSQQILNVMHNDRTLIGTKEEKNQKDEKEEGGIFNK